MGFCNSRQRWIFSAVPILLVVLTVASAGAQGLFNQPSSGVLSQTMTYGGSCCNPCASAPHLDFYVGWQGGDKQTLSANTDQHTPGALFRSIKFEIPNEGVWVGAGAAFDVACKFSLGVQGWYMFPSHKSARYTVDPGLPVVIELPGNLNPKVDWWYVDVLGKYRYWDQWSFVLGSRFDHHNFSSNDSDFIVLDPLANPFRLDLNALTTSLFFGLEFSNPNSLTLRAVYAPLSWSSGLTRLGQSHLLIPPLLFGPNKVQGGRNTNPSYLVELFAEYSKPVTADTKMGIFGRATWLHSSGRSSLDETVRQASADYDFSYYCTSWTIGGKAEIAFNLSGLFY